jgi:hypothetical protein
MNQAIDPVSEISPSSEPLALDDVTSEASRNATVEQSMSAALSNAIEHASTIPGGGAQAAGARAELVNPFVGAFGAEKQELLSDVERTGAEPGGAPDREGVEVVAETLKGLMHELTTWHVTWGIAQTAQKDLTHVLKS